MSGAYARVCVVKVLSASMAKRTEVTFTFHWLCTECSRFSANLFSHNADTRESGKEFWKVQWISYKIEVRCIKLLTKKDLNITELYIGTIQGLGSLKPPHIEISQDLNICRSQTHFRLNARSYV